MSDPVPTRPGQVVLDDAVCAAIGTAIKEWDLTTYEVIGVLTTIAHRMTYQLIDSQEELE